MLEPSCHPGGFVASTSYAAMLFAGFSMSVGHCVGMCGPIQMTFSVEQTKRGSVAASLVLYHLGRVFSYALIGAVFGVLGASTAWFAPDSPLQGVLSVTAGLLMVLFVVRGFPNLAHGTAWGAWASRGVGRALRMDSKAARFGLGMANGFLPCGPVWAAALAAAGLAHPVTGALLMTAYGLGTTPVLTALGLSAKRWGVPLRQKFLRYGSVIVVLIGAQLALRGFAQLGWIPHGAVGPVVFW